jgi:hypothetical protein
MQVPKKLLQWLRNLFPSRIALTPEDKLIADSFKANREVSWPVEKGFISLDTEIRRIPFTTPW